MLKGCGAVLMFLVIILLTACGSETAKDDAAGPASVAQPEQAARVVEVTLSFIEPRFRPDPIEIRVGEPIQFKVTSADTRHRFSIEQLGIDVEVPQKSLNESVTTKVVTPNEAGTFRILCSVHARMPMEGTLVITEGQKP